MTPDIYDEYKPKKIVNTHKHVDGPWFWGKYTAHPYIGCRFGCEFCYSRGGRYVGRRDPALFDKVIRVKVNAVDLLRKEMPRLSREVISVGDWQPAERRYRLSRQMLEVVREQGFPLFIVERSPLLARDLDLLKDINEQSWVGVVYSISTLDRTIKRTFEPKSPSVRRRLLAMERLAEAGILVGTAMLPLLPFVGDDEKTLNDLVRATKDHGGSFIMGGGLTMDGIQARRTLAAATELDPALEPKMRKLYRWTPDGKPQYGPSQRYSSWLGLRLRSVCSRQGIPDRMPRYIEPGPLAANKRVAEKLFLKTYDLELEMADSRRIWAYRRAAWTVDEWPESVADIYRARGQAGLRELPSIGGRLAGLIASWLDEMSDPVDQSDARPTKP